MSKMFSTHKDDVKKKEESKKQLPEEPLNIETITWGDVTWVNIEAATERETAWLADTYHFHQLALDDCISRKQIPKIDTYPGYPLFRFPLPSL